MDWYKFEYSSYTLDVFIVYIITHCAYNIGVDGTDISLNILPLLNLKNFYYLQHYSILDNTEIDETYISLSNIYIYIYIYIYNW